MFIDSFADYFLKNEQNITYRKFQSQFQWPFKDFFIGRKIKVILFWEWIFFL
jgi:hypothetical protein